MENFYVFLPSNSPVEGNVTGNYTVRLPNTIDLSEGEWSVALSSIIYPTSYQTGSKKEMFIIINYYNNNHTKITIPSDITFSSIAHLQKTINDSIISRQKRSVLVDREKRAADVEERQMQAAKNEVHVRSYKQFHSYKEEIEEKIFEIEVSTAKIEDLLKWVKENAKPNPDFTSEEISDIINQLKINSSSADRIRSSAQNKRKEVTSANDSYNNIIKDFDIASKQDNVSDARKIADRAKKLVEELKDLLKFIEEYLTNTLNFLENSQNKYEEVLEYMQPLPTGLKNNINRVKETILKSLSNEQKNVLEIYFFYDDNFSRFFLYNHKSNAIKSVQISEKLAYILGFEIDKVTNEVKKLRLRQGGGFAKYSPDISSGIHQLYVYSPGLIESSFVGDKQAPLLRIINVEKPPNLVAENIYTNMYYMRVIEKRISSIKIIIKDSFNDILNFNWGNVIITLAFKRNIF